MSGSAADVLAYSWIGVRQPPGHGPFRQQQQQQQQKLSRQKKALRVKHKESRLSNNINITGSGSGTGNFCEASAAAPSRVTISIQGSASPSSGDPLHKQSSRGATCLSAGSYFARDSPEELTGWHRSDDSAAAAAASSSGKHDAFAAKHTHLQQLPQVGGRNKLRHLSAHQRLRQQLDQQHPAAAAAAAAAANVHQTEVRVVNLRAYNNPASSSKLLPTMDRWNNSPGVVASSSDSPRPAGTARSQRHRFDSHTPTSATSFFSLTPRSVGSVDESNTPRSQVSQDSHSRNSSRGTVSRSSRNPRSNNSRGSSSSGSKGSQQRGGTQDRSNNHSSHSAVHARRWGSNGSWKSAASASSRASAGSSTSRSSSTGSTGSSRQRRRRSSKQRMALDVQQQKRILQQHYRHHQFHPLQHKYPVMTPRLVKIHAPGASPDTHGSGNPATQVPGDRLGPQGLQQEWGGPTSSVSRLPFRVNGRPAPVAKRRLPMLWLSLKINWGKASPEHKEALRQLARESKLTGRKNNRPSPAVAAAAAAAAATASGSGAASADIEASTLQPAPAPPRASGPPAHVHVGPTDEELSRRRVEGARLLRAPRTDQRMQHTTQQSTPERYLATQHRANEDEEHGGDEDDSDDEEEEDFDEERFNQRYQRMPSADHDNEDDADLQYSEGPVTTVSWVCEVCTFNNAPGTNYCQMCECDAPDQSNIDMNQVLACGLTLAQVEELQTRDISPEDFQVLLELDERVPKKTLKQEDVDAFVRATFSADDEAVDCGICLCEVEVGDEFVRLPCNHAFHDECITRWLTEYNTKCPFKCDGDLKKK